MRAALWTVVPRLSAAELDALVENLTTMVADWRERHVGRPMPAGLFAVRTVSLCVNAVADSALAFDLAELVVAAGSLQGEVATAALDDVVAVLADERGKRL